MKLKYYDQHHQPFLGHTVDDISIIIILKYPMMYEYSLQGKSYHYDILEEL